MKVQEGQKTGEHYRSRGPHQDRGKSGSAGGTRNRGARGQWRHEGGREAAHHLHHRKQPLVPINASPVNKRALRQGRRPLRTAQVTVTCLQRDGKPSPPLPEAVFTSHTEQGRRGANLPLSLSHRCRSRVWGEETCPLQTCRIYHATQRVTAPRGLESGGDAADDDY